MGSVKQKYNVKSIGVSEIKEWLLKKHYAKRMCHVMYSFGLFSSDNILCGVITFGQPAGSTISASICGNEYSKYVLELNRLVVNGGLDKNTLSYFVGNSIRKIPSDRILVSFSDMNMGHHGYIYQATNFIYTGMTDNTTQLIDKDGKEFHFRNIGHYQENNRLNVGLVKRRVGEENISRVDIANFLRKNKNGYTARKLDQHFGYKDTCAHWFRLDAGFSFPSVDDWIELKELLGFDDTYDKVMCDYKLVPCPQQIIEKLELRKVKVLPKHRYVFFKGSRSFKRSAMRNLKLDILEYPKGNNKHYDASYKPTVQKRLF